MATADLNFCSRTCSRILNMFPKPYCGFVVIIVVVPGGSVSVRIVNFSKKVSKVFKPENLYF